MGTAMRCAMKPFSRPTTRELTLLAVCTALLFGAQTAMAALPNIEVVTLLVLLYSRWFGRKALLIIYTFVLLEGAFYGIHLWWIAYLYVWTVLWLAVRLLDRRCHSSLFWAAVGGCFGFSFGLLCALPTLAIAGLPAAVGWWIAGIPFDLVHGCANFAIIWLLYDPLERLRPRLLS